MKLKCLVCNSIFEEEEMYNKTKDHYTDLVVKPVYFSKSGNVKVPHLYICPICNNFLNNATLRKEDG